MADVVVSWAGRRVLVTGHTGFKGAWLVLDLLRRGARVSGLSCGTPSDPSLWGLLGLDGELEAAWDHDVRAPLPDAVRGFDVVLHLAAQPLVRASYADPVATWQTNVVGTANVLAATAPDAGAVVVVTSDKCYRNDGSGRAFREADPLGGDDPYSASKAAQEHVAASWRASFSAPVATARAGNVIGGGDWGADRLVPDLVRGDGRVELRNPDATRPWQHVLEPLSGYVRLAEAVLDGAFPEAVNFGPAPGDVRRVREVVDAWPGASWTLAEGAHPHEAPALALDAALAGEALGWAPRWGLDEGLRRTHEWYAAWRAGEDVRAISEAQLADFEAALG